MCVLKCIKIYEPNDLRIPHIGVPSKTLVRMNLSNTTIPIRKLINASMNIFETRKIMKNDKIETLANLPASCKK